MWPRGKRLLDELEIAEDRRLPLTGMDAFAAAIRARAESANVCVLADGDPLLYGLGASLLRYFAPGEPDISSQCLGHADSMRPFRPALGTTAGPCPCMAVTT